MRTNVWIYQALVCVVVLDTGCCRRTHQSLQKYEKTESHMLVCTDCPQPSLVRSSRSQEHCARKCKKVKKNFNCRAFNFQRHNRKCHLLPFDRFTHGVQKQANTNFTLYEKKDYIRECIIGTKDNYRGRRSWTKSNITCQAWSDNNINEHTFYPDRYPTQDLRENFCRNPNNDPGGPWCYTTDPNVRAEECGIPQCSEEVCITCNGEDYRGKVDHTESGKDCQRWDSARPHKHHFQPKKYKDKDLKDNYCRNPDNRMRPWCYTTDPKTPWEYCNITVCDSNSNEDTDVNVTTSCVQGKGTDYRGTMNVTPEGVTCQRWDSQFPHNHSFLPKNFKCKDLRENYCRNPDGADYPWCFTTDPNQRIANCTHIPSGDSHSTVSHVGLEKNYCRNPDQDKHGPWCYTNPNNRLAWDYCKLKHYLREYSVQVGLRQLNESSNHPRLRISRLICGPEGSNLVMLKLADPAPVSEGASTIHLPVKECHITEGTNCTMYGWGETKNTERDETLNAVTMPMVNNDMCSQIKGDAGESRICAGGKRGEGKDNGGPLVCQEHERKVIIGVSIQRTKCASSQPALFVNVAFYSEWIYKVFKFYPSLERN
eukprot:superscaffoldBa00003147_g16232